MLLQCISEMTAVKYDKYTIYAHNLGGFDAAFIYLLMERHGYKTSNLIVRDEDIIKFKLSYKVKKKISLCCSDSMAILPYSLEDLGIAFNVEVRKYIFPHKFVHANNLNYDGPLPDLKYYINKKNNDIVFLYKDLADAYRNKSWKMRDEVLSYLRSDVVSLWQILDKADNHYFKNYRINITKYPTISSISMGIFRSHFLKDNVLLPRTKGDVDKAIRESFYGGRNEVFKPFGYGLYGYDCNSLYPAAMLMDMPVGTPIYSLQKDINKIFGTVRVKVTAPPMRIPVLPCRIITKSGDSKLIFPSGSWEGWYFSEEVKLSIKYGYKIEVVESYIFERGFDVFKEYIVHFFNLKKNAKTPTEKETSKLNLNTLFGRMGMSNFRDTYNRVSKKKFEELELIFDIKAFIELNEDQVFVRHSKLPSWDKCQQTGNDYESMLLKYGDNDDNIINNSSAIAAATASWARILMYPHLEKSYYTDTDSTYQNKPLSPELIGNEKGQFKLLHGGRTKKALFPAPKLYLIDSVEGIRCKSKGYSGELSVWDYMTLLGGDSINVKDERWITNLAEETVTVLPEQEFKISGDYDKRNKLFSKGKWVDTSPLVINEKFEIVPLDLVIRNMFNIVRYTQIYSLTILILDLGAKRVVNLGLMLLTIPALYLIVAVIYVTVNGVCLNYQQFNNKIYTGLISYSFYITPSGICLNYKNFNSNVHYGLMVYIFYISNNCVVLNYIQFQNKIYAGIIPYIYYITPNNYGLDYQLFKGNIHAGLSVYVLYVSNTVVIIDYQQFRSKIYLGIVSYIYYITPNSCALDYRLFMGKINVTLMVYIFKRNACNTDVTLDYMQYISYINRGLMVYVFYISKIGVVLDYQQYHRKIHAGLSVYVLYVTTASKGITRGICVEYQQFKNKIYVGIIIYIFPLNILGAVNSSNVCFGCLNDSCSTLLISPPVYVDEHIEWECPKAIGNFWWLDPIKAFPPYWKFLLKNEEVIRLYSWGKDISLNRTNDGEVLYKWKWNMLFKFYTFKRILKNEGPHGLKNEKITSVFVYWYINTFDSYLDEMFIFEYVTTSFGDTWLIRRKTPYETVIEKLCRNDYYSRDAQAEVLEVWDGRTLEILNNPNMYNTYTFEDCNLCESYTPLVTKHNIFGWEFNKPSNIYERGYSLNKIRSASDKRNYSTSEAAQHVPIGTAQGLISKDDLKKEGIPIDHDFEKYNALTPFRCSADIILSPLYLTKTLLNSLDKSEELLSKLSSDNIVKTFLLNKLNDKFILTAKLGCDWVNILKTVKLKERYNRDTPYLNDFGTYFPGISNSKIDFSSYRSNIFILSNVYWRLDGWYNGDYLLFSEILRQGYSSRSEDSLCGCYIIYTRHPLYYYIGYSMHLRNRLRMQRQNILSHSATSTQWDFYISSCCYNKVDIVFMAGPICLYKNYFKAFIQKYPDYKLSVAEFLILRFYTELIGKILEQSLIYYYNPLLNTSIYTTVKNIIWNDKYLNIPYTTRMSGVTSNKPSNISKSNPIGSPHSSNDARGLGRDTKDSHSFLSPRKAQGIRSPKNGSFSCEPRQRFGCETWGFAPRRRNYSTKPPRFANVIYPDPWRDTLIILDRDDFKNEGISSFRTQDVDHNLKKYNALIPFKNSTLLFPIVLTKTLLYYLDKSEDCLSKLSLASHSATENLVKKFILDMLEQKFKITVRLLSGSRNLLDIIKSKDPYVKKPIYQRMDDRYILSHTEVNYSEIDFSSLPKSAANLFRLSKIYGCLRGRFVNNSFEFVEVKKDKSLLDDFEFTPCGCYVIYSKKTLYYYIGYSSNIINRLNTHYLNLKSLRALGLGDLWCFYLKSCIEKKVKIDIEMGPVCLYPNYLKTFLTKYPDYKLNVGEYFILELYTDLVGKILEQSLIYHYNPLLNSSIHPAIKNIDWSDKYLTIPYTPKYKRNKVRYWVHWPNIPFCPSLKTELYLIQRYNLDIKEVWANLGKLHHYKHSMLLRQPVIIDRIDDNKEIEILQNNSRFV